MKYFICARRIATPSKNLYTAFGYGDPMIGAVYPEIPDTKADYEWLECRGQAVSQFDYPELFAAIGTNYGDGASEFTFILPHIQLMNV